MPAQRARQQPGCSELEATIRAIQMLTPRPMLIPHGSHTHLRLEGRGHLTFGLQLPLHCAADSNLSVQLLSSVPGGVCSLSGGPRSGAGLLASSIRFGLGLLHVTLKLRTPNHAKGGVVGGTQAQAHVGGCA